MNENISQICLIKELILFIANDQYQYNINIQYIEIDNI